MSRTTLKWTLLAAFLGAVIGAKLAWMHNGGTIPGVDMAVWRPAWDDTFRREGPALAFFILLSVYWAVAARNEAPDKTPEALWSRILHQVLVNAGAVIIVAPIPGLLTRVLPNGDEFIIAGTVVAAIGVMIAVWARRALGRNWSAAVRIAEDHQLVRTGPYRFVRHPIYTGVLGLYLGLAVASGTVHALLGFVLICLAYWRKIGLEEKILHRNFGAAYEDYRRHSKAVIPFLL